MSNILNGKSIANEIKSEAMRRVNDLMKRGIVPCLAVISVGEDPASAIYVRNKRRACEEVGIVFKHIKLGAYVHEVEVIEKVNEFNNDDSIHAILVQLPLPMHIDENAVLDAILPEKDADGFHVINAGRLLTGRSCILPCTPCGCMEMLLRNNIQLVGKEAVVIGRSNIVGKPMALLLQAANCTVTVCHSYTANLADHVKRADIVVCAVGKPGLINGDMLKEGAVVLDVGINRLEDGKIVGDVDFESASKVTSWISPVPGGVGAMTVAMLLLNTIILTEKMYLED